VHYMIVAQLFSIVVETLCVYFRMKFLVKKWRRATRVGAEVVGATVEHTNGRS